MVMAAPAQKVISERSMEEHTVRFEERVDRLQSDMAEVKSDIRRIDTKVDAVKDSLATHRVETKDAIAGLRLEMRDGFAEQSQALAILEGRTQAGFAEQGTALATLEGKMQAGFAEQDGRMQKALAAIELSIQKLSSGVRIAQLIERFWWIGVAAIIFGVVARALDWI
jgi:hypothetical protein